jgi:hypothetical protein
MAKVAPIQTAFNAGEFSPLLYGRVDFEKYGSALKTCENLVPLVQGPVTRRPGTIYVAEVKTSSTKTRVVRFEFSTTQAYILEFGDLYMRVYASHARVGTVEVVTTYTEDEIFDLKFAQSADTLYVAHPAHAPAKVTRASHTSWAIADLAFLDGPWLPVNGTATTLTFGATTGTGVSCTASAATFASTDVGRQIRAKTTGAKWGWATITGYTSTTVVTVTINEDMGATTATANWRLGVWSDTTGYPSVVTFYQDRLLWDGGAAAPQTIYGSRTGDYLNHAPTDYATTPVVADDNSLAIAMNSRDVQVIRWMLPDEKGLLVGTVKGEWAVRPSASGEALTPTNQKADQLTRYGSSTVAPAEAGATALYVQRSGRVVRELVFVFADDKYKSPDMTRLAEHITYGGITEIAFQLAPLSVLWAVRDDGVLLGFTYERDESVVGWHRHILGGVFGSGDAIVESVAVIPNPAGDADEVWMVVKRTVNGGTVRYLEYMSKVWERGDTQETSVYFDSAVVYDSTATTTITGLGHLEGETVAVKADGAAHPDKTVASGTITLDVSATQVVVGLGYNSDGVTLRNNAGAVNGTAQGKTQRKHRLAFRLHDTLGFSAGPALDDLEPHIVRVTTDASGQPPGLFSGDWSKAWPGGYSTDDLVAFRFNQGFPGTLEAIMPQQDTQDR